MDVGDLSRKSELKKLLHPFLGAVLVSLFRNGKTLVEKFICWDGCPELGNVYLFYQGVDTEEACLDAAGSPLISPVPIPGAYWGCEPIVDGLSVPARRSG